MPPMSKMVYHIIKRPRVAVCQLTSNHVSQENAQKCQEFIFRAAESGCHMVFFPECSDFIARNKDEALACSGPITNQSIKTISKAAAENKIWVSIGGFHNRKSNDTLPSNTHVIIDSSGNIVAEYDKLHQFNIDIPGKVRLMEREFSSHGTRLVRPVETPIGKIGLGICYDLRFPELSIYNRTSGADILTFPAAFTVPTGMAHWEVLLRARAIENQCYVIAAAQFGEHNKNRSSYGHAMIVDPFGKVIAQCSDKEGFAITEIDLDYQREIRKNLCVFADRRNDLYTLYFNEKLDLNTTGPAKFGNIDIMAEYIFFRSRLSFAFVNLKPIVPGHVLVSPTRVVQRLNNLTLAENADLFNTAQRVVKMLEKYYGTDSTTISIQDGKYAGQTIPHVHIHVIPRRQNDFGKNPDRVYQELDSETRPMRSDAEMIAEAAVFRFGMYQ